MDSRQEPSTRTVGVVATFLVATALLFAVAAGAGSAIHPEDAPQAGDAADFEVNLPFATDHYPGDQNEANGSIEYFAAGEEAFEEQDAEEGFFIDIVIVHAEYQGEDWIDYSECETANTVEFGIDRGNNNSGIRVDEDLVARQKQSIFRDDGIVVKFHSFDEFADDPPYLAAEDAVVAAQGWRSNEGPCLTLTSEPGWYRIAAFTNGTVADNGPDEEPSEDADRVSLELKSNYLYVCECDSEAEARQQLGPPPNEQDGGDTGGTDPTPTATPAPTATPTPTPEPDDTTPTPATATPTATATATPTPTPADSADEGDSTDNPSETGDTDGAGETATPTPTPDDGGGGGAAAQGGNGGAAIGETPTPGEGPGFGPVAAVLALLAAALLVGRRG